MNSLHPAPKLVVPALLAATLVSARLSPLAAQGGPPAAAHYRSLTNNSRSFTNFNVEVVRGFAIYGTDAYAVNAYASTIVHYSNYASASGVVQPQDNWRTLNNPVSIALYNGDLYVVGQGNHALARHSRIDGRILDVLQLPSEPADIAIDTENAIAWVSCMGADCVVQVDLGGAAMTVVKRWSWDDGLRLKRPRFLALDLGDPNDPADNAVHVAPLISGNNTLITNREPTIPPSPDSGIVKALVRNGNDVNLFPNGGLPDEDLFRITPDFPQATPPVQGVVTACVRGAGSLILAHGRNPVTGQYWMLNVQHKNVDAVMVDEPSSRGMFARNRLSRAVLSNGGIVRPAAIVDLDDYDPSTSGNQYLSSRSLSFPYALDFAASGGAAIASSTAPLVVLTDANGLRNQELALSLGSAPPAGAAGLVPRTVKFVGSDLLVYCQQTSNLQIWDVSAAPATWRATLSLGMDPTPTPIRKGRAIWYDAVPSQDGHTSCNTCHPQGGADGLVWRIANKPVDDKPPMVTQPLFGIEDTFPYHWRGERSLADFNAAFPGLLGHAGMLPDLPSLKLQQFLEFVFSLTPPANPLQDFDRMVKPSLVGRMETDLTSHPGLISDPIHGESIFHDVNRPTDNVGHCSLCHMDPTGSNGDFNAELTQPIATHSVLKVAHLDNQLALKRQPLVDVVWEVNDGGHPPLVTTATFKSNLLGSGTAHTGQILNLPEFVDHFFGTQTTLPVALTALEAADVAGFVSLFDTGTAPAVHFTARLDVNSPTSVVADIQQHLIDQALPTTGSDHRGKGVGIVVLGSFPVSGVAVPMTWYFDPTLSTPAFVPANDQPLGPSGPTIAPQPFSAFQNQPLADNVFLGTPPGNERRLGADYDNDGLDLRAELAAGTSPWNADTDGDGWQDGTEVANGSSPVLANGAPANTALAALVTDPNGANVEIDFVNSSQVKLHFATTEPARWKITLEGRQSGQTTVVTTASASRLSHDVTHTALVHGLEPSTIQTSGILTRRNVYSGTIELWDLHSASSGPIPLVFRSSGSSAATSFDSAPNEPVGGKLPLVVSDLRWASETRSGSSFKGQVEVQVSKREDGPPWPVVQNRVVVAQLLKANGADWEVVPIGDVLPFDPTNPIDDRNPAPNYDASNPAAHLNFRIDANAGTPRWYRDDATPANSILPGAFLVLLPTDASGRTWCDFEVANLSTGQQVMFNILAIEPLTNMISPHDPQAPVLKSGDLVFWQMPATPKQFRNLVSTQ